MTRRRAALVALCVATLTLGACSDGKAPGGDDPSGDAASWLRLPSEAPEPVGPPVGPEMQAKVLLSGVDELEGALGNEKLETLGRSTGAFVTGQTVVGYTTDEVSGYDLGSGEQTWTADISLDGGQMCFTSQPAPGTDVEWFTVVYGPDRSCSQLATVRVADGEVLSETDLTEESFRLEDLSGIAEQIHTFAGKDYLRDFEGNIWAITDQGLDRQSLTQLEDSSYFWIDPTPQGDLLVAKPLDESSCEVQAYNLPEFTLAWRTPVTEIFPEAEDCIVSEVAGNSLWVRHEGSQREYLAQLDAETGKVIGQASAPRGERPEEGVFDVDAAALFSDRTIGLPDGDVVFPQVHGISRYSLVDGEADWSSRMDQWEMARAGRALNNMRTFRPSAITPDGRYVVGTVSNDVSVEVVAFTADSGDLVARWPLPAEYGNGFQTQPGLALFDGGVVLTRNFQTWGQAFGKYGEKKTSAERFDIGVFTFPEAEEAGQDGDGAKGEDPDTQEPVSVRGPARSEATVAGVMRAPDGTPEEHLNGAFTLGEVLITHSGNTVEARPVDSPQDVLWSEQVTNDPKRQVCASHVSAGAADSFLLGTSAGGDDCQMVTRISTADGKVLEQARVPAGVEGFSTVEAYEDLEYFEADSRIWTLTDGKVTQIARLRGSTWSEGFSAQDPSLMVGATRPAKGGNWSIVGYRLPDFEVVWETTSKKVLGRTSGDNDPVSVWDANGLWVSTTFEHPSGEYDKATEVLAELDPDTGKVVAKAGPMKRTTKAPGGIKRFHLDGAINSYLGFVGMDDGDVLLSQQHGVMRYSLADDEVVWGIDTTSLENSMERPTGFEYDSTLINRAGDDGPALVTFANNTSVELMEVDPETGTATGRWKVPKDDRNGVQTSPDVVAFPGGVVLLHSSSSWDYQWSQPGRTEPSGPINDVVVLQLEH